MTPAAAVRQPAAKWIRDSKLAVREPRVMLIRRERLLTRLAAGATARVVLISAAPGYGKSTLAAQWAARCRRPVAWVNLDGGDNDRVVLLSYVAHALDRLGAVDPELLDELSGPAPRVEDVVLPALAAEFERLSPFELVLDDVHALSNPGSLAALGFLLGEIPPGSQVVLAARADVDLPLASYRVSGDLLEITAADLALDADEMRALATSRDRHFSERSLALLRERTEGWAAGVALAMQAADDDASGNAVARGISGQKREIADYLIEVVLARETEGRQRFLLATSVLLTMTAPVCDAVLGITGSSAMLRELERSHSFLFALDDHRGRYRYHHLFREVLRAELDRLHPELAAVYLGRAAEWYELDGDDPEEAFRCAHECGDLQRAGRIALASWDVFGSRGQLETMRLWLDDCTEAEIASDPQLALAAAWVYALLGEADRAGRCVVAAQRSDLDVPSADGAASLRSSLANLLSTLAPSGVGQMLADAKYVYESEEGPSRTRWRIGGCRGIGIANILLGRPEEAIAVLREAMTLTADRPDLVHARILPLGFIALAAADMGRWSEARRWAHEAAALVAEHRLGGSVTAAPALTARATVLAHDGDYRAKAALAEALSLGRVVRLARWALVDMHIRWGNVSAELGDRTAAREHAGEARAALHGYPDPGALPDRLARLDERIARAEELGLTPAELQVAAFLPAHHSLQEIAELLSLSRATVKTHVASIYTKLEVSTRSEAVKRLAEHEPRGADWPARGGPGARRD